MNNTVKFKQHAKILVISRRSFLILSLGIMIYPLLGSKKVYGEGKTMSIKIDKIHKTEEEWSRLLTPEQFYVLREEGTERPYSSPLNAEKRKGTYVCAGCELPLFAPEMKYESGTGWPSFFTSIEGHLETKRDFKLIFPRTEYHCARCGGHHGHLFNDGPPPTGQRWCNNGVALKFIPA